MLNIIKVFAAVKLNYGGGFHKQPNYKVLNEQKIIKYLNRGF
jgi:hypothetical protein